MPTTPHATGFLNVDAEFLINLTFVAHELPPVLSQFQAYVPVSIGTLTRSDLPVPNTATL